MKLIDKSKEELVNIILRKDDVYNKLKSEYNYVSYSYKDLNEDYELVIKDYNKLAKYALCSTILMIVLFLFIIISY